MGGRKEEREREREKERGGGGRVNKSEKMRGEERSVPSSSGQIETRKNLSETPTAQKLAVR